VAAGAARILAEPAAALDKRDPVPEQHAPQRMADERPLRRMVHERVAATARVLGPAVALRDGMHPVAEQPAEIAHALVEDAAVRIRIVPHGKQQRVPAAHARVFGVAMALRDSLVGVLHEKTPKGVSHVHHAPVVAQHRTAAARAGAIAAFVHLVLHRMTPDGAQQSRQHELPS